MITDPNILSAMADIHSKYAQGFFLNCVASCVRRFEIVFHVQFIHHNENIEKDTVTENPEGIAIISVFFEVIEDYEEEVLKDEEDTLWNEETMNLITNAMESITELGTNNML